MKIILVTGIPGMGKTTIGNHLKDHYDFYHIDLEDPHLNSSKEFVQFIQENLDAEKLIGEIKNKDKDSVITWGFYPGFYDPKVLKLQQLGAKMFWLDGDRTLAKNAWRRRDNPIPDKVFDRQVAKIDKHDIQGIFSPIVLDTFDNSKKKHRDIEEIIGEIFSKFEKEIKQ